MVIWQSKTNQSLYEVRSAGNTLRLYENNVLHTQYNPNTILTNRVWDLLFLPALFHPQGQRVLILGVGGGAVIHLLRKFVSPREIVGIDLNATHLYIAQHFFNLYGDDVTLIESDAKQWLQQYEGEKFDLIIDDLFCVQNRQPVRAIRADNAWLHLVLRYLSEEGVLVMNFIDMNSFSFAIKQNALKNIASIYRLSNDIDENLVGAFLQKKSTRRQLRHRLQGYSGLAKRLQYRIKKFK